MDGSVTSLEASPNNPGQIKEGIILGSRDLGEILAVAPGDEKRMPLTDRVSIAEGKSEGNFLDDFEGFRAKQTLPVMGMITGTRAEVLIIPVAFGAVALGVEHLQVGNIVGATFGHAEDMIYIKRCVFGLSPAEGSARITFLENPIHEVISHHSKVERFIPPQTL